MVVRNSSRCFCHAIGLFTARHYASAVLAVVCVCLSVARRYCDKTAKHKLTVTTPPRDSSWQLHQSSWQNGEMGYKKLEIMKFWTNVDPCKFIWGAPRILKPVLDTPFQGLLPGKIWTTHRPYEGENNFAPKFFWEGSPWECIN